VQQQAAEPNVGDRARPRAWLAGEWARMMSVDRLGLDLAHFALRLMADMGLHSGIADCFGSIS
jgi:hypothetical protein